MRIYICFTCAYMYRENNVKLHQNVNNDDCRGMSLAEEMGKG